MQIVQGFADNPTPDPAGTFAAIGFAMPEQPLLQDPGRASAHVLASAIALARAEAKLVASQVLAKGRTLASRASIAVAMTWLAMTLAQIALALLAVSPVLVAFRPWPVVLAMVAPAVTLAAAAAFLTLRQWRLLVEAAGSPSKRHAPAPDPGKATSELHARV